MTLAMVILMITGTVAAVHLALVTRPILSSSSFYNCDHLLLTWSFLPFPLCLSSYFDRSLESILSPPFLLSPPWLSSANSLLKPYNSSSHWCLSVPYHIPLLPHLTKSQVFLLPKSYQVRIRFLLLVLKAFPNKLETQKMSFPSHILWPFPHHLPV